MTQTSVPAASPAPAPPIPPDAPMGAEAVRAQLERVLASEMFASSGRLSRLLRFTVEQALAGQGERLKEYVLGIEVFDRAEEYDPRIDSIVRVEARRLRTKLDEYYTGPGGGDPIVIRFRKGSYVPSFERREAPPAPAAGRTDAASRPASRRPRFVALALVLAAAVGGAAWLTLAAGRGPGAGVTADARPSVAVLPLAHFSTDPALAALADRVTDGLTAELARHGSLAVASRTTTMQYRQPRGSLREIAGVLGADFILEGSVTAAGDAVRVEVRLVDAATDRKTWVDAFDGAPDRLPDLQRRVAAAAAAAIERRRVLRQAVPESR